MVCQSPLIQTSESLICGQCSVTTEGLEGAIRHPYILQTYLIKHDIFSFPSFLRLLRILIIFYSIIYNFKIFDSLNEYFLKYDTYLNSQI